MTGLTISKDNISVLGVGDASTITNVCETAANVIAVTGDNVLVRDLRLVSNGVEPLREEGWVTA